MRSPLRHRPKHKRQQNLSSVTCEVAGMFPDVATFEVDTTRQVPGQTASNCARFDWRCENCFLVVFVNDSLAVELPGKVFVAVEIASP